MLNLQKIAEYRKFKANPTLAQFASLQEIRKEIIEIMNEQHKKLYTELLTDLTEQLNILLQGKEAQKVIERVVEKNTTEDMFRAMKVFEKNIKGDRGDKGEVGLVGPQGKQGEKGLRGEQGPQGFTGERGPQGERGLFGKDGSPDTGEQIAEKVNKFEEIIERKTIKGLEKIIANLQRAVNEKTKSKISLFGGGGGMGNWITEVPSGTVNGSNTTFTLTSGVSGGGKAIILLINGQVQEYTTHFTVSSKTITMTSAPLTNDAIFVMYVRK